MAGIANLFDKVLNKRGQPRLDRDPNSPTSRFCYKPVVLILKRSGTKIFQASRRLAGIATLFDKVLNKRGQPRLNQDSNSPTLPARRTNFKTPWCESVLKMPALAGIANLFDKVLNKRGQPRLNRMLMPGALEEEPSGGRCPSASHMRTFIIYKLGVDENYYTLTSMSLIKIVL